MALTYTGSNIALGNPLMGALPTDTLSVWGAAFVEEGRFLLVLVRTSGGSLVWKKVDPLTLQSVTYDTIYPPTTAGIALGDRGAETQGQFLSAEGDYLYYLKGNVLHRIVYDSGVSAGFHTLRTTTGVNLNGSTINAFTLSPVGLCVVSATDGKVYFYPSGSLVWNNSALNATNQITEPLFSSSTVRGAFVQPVTHDLIVLTSGGGSRALRFNATASERKGSTLVVDSDGRSSFHVGYVVSCQFRGSVLYFTASDNSFVGAGVYVFRFADASTGVVAKDQSGLTVSESRVQVASGTVVRVGFRALDGWGDSFPSNDYVRFSVLKIGDVFDRNDGALSVSPLGPFRDAQDSPINPELDVQFGSNGEAVCYWHTPLELNVDVLYHRIRAKYPIF
jgi:hypothetical protein